MSDLDAALAWFWHPVATVAELDAAGGILATRLLDRDLVLARLADGSLALLVDRCPHRSTRLSVGWVEGASIRCAYHGWRWDAGGRCVEIPSAPRSPVPPRFRQDAFDVEERHGLVWGRLRSGAPTSIPPVPAADGAPMRVVTGDPYVWPTSAPRRVENFVDLAHFPWVHDGSLARRADAVPPEVDLDRVDGELRFTYTSPGLASPDDAALIGPSWYRMPMPLTVDIAFLMPRPQAPPARRHLWMTAAPLDPATCRTYWSIARDDDLDGPDEPHLAFQHRVIEEDRPLVCNQVPAEIPLEVTGELHVKADKVSLEYRRWLRELVEAAGDAASLSRALGAAYVGAA
ncbi:MAG: aromatic ring-hydroxylating dioxygenase subunit alpha [Acidimicrobiaceae bacterium]|nr:aromatic ring-hydroxylating dioxygenase subunit alpha [Acidimicrobiaceae bacterium]